MRFWISLMLGLALAGCSVLPPLRSTDTLTPAPSASATPSASPSATVTATATLTATPEPTATFTPQPSPTAPAVLLLQDPPIRHALVAEYQQRLVGLGYREVTAADGVYDAQTAAAVLHFEWQNGLPPDGVLDAECAARLLSPDALPMRLAPPFAGRILRRGMYVHALETPLLEQLAVLGYRPSGLVDAQGKFTAGDESALAIFQYNNGLPASGVLDQATWERVFSPRAVMADGRLANGGLPEQGPAGALPPGWDSAVVPLLDAGKDSPGVVQLALLGGMVWLARGDSTLIAYDPAARQIHGPIFAGDLNLQDGPAEPLGLARVGGVLWLGSLGVQGPQIQGFDPLSGLARTPLQTGRCEGCSAPVFAFDGRRVWLAGPGDAIRAVYLTNGAAFIVRKLEAAPAGAITFDAAGQCLWVALAGGALAAVDPGEGLCRASGQVIQAGVTLGAEGRLLLAAENGLVMLAERGTHHALVYDGLSGTLLAAPLFDQPLSALAAAGGQLWVAEAGGRLMPFDPASLAPGAPLELGCTPLALTGSADALWAACADGTLHQVQALSSSAR